MKRRTRFEFITALLLSVFCVTGKAGETTTNTPPQQPATKVRLLTPSDVVEIKVYRQPDLDMKARLDAKGMITMPLLGPLKLGGLSPEEARILMRDLLDKDYLVNPQVTLTITEYAKSLFTVMGEVQRPGSYEIPPEQSVTLLQAIAMAGGYTRMGAPGKVMLQRVQDGQKRVLRLNTTAMAADEKSAALEILPGDTIWVGERVF